MNAIAVCKPSVATIRIARTPSTVSQWGFLLSFHVFHKSYLNSDPLFIELLPTQYNNSLTYAKSQVSL
jgi:hypothetical protein